MTPEARIMQVVAEQMLWQRFTDVLDAMDKLHSGIQAAAYPKEITSSVRNARTALLPAYDAVVERLVTLRGSGIPEKDLAA